MKQRSILIFIGFAAILSLLYVRSRFLVVELSFEINELRQANKSLDMQYRDLKLQYMSMTQAKKIYPKLNALGLSYEHHASSRKVYVQEP